MYKTSLECKRQSNYTTIKFCFRMKSCKFKEKWKYRQIDGIECGKWLMAHEDDSQKAICKICFKSPPFYTKKGFDSVVRHSRNKGHKNALQNFIKSDKNQVFIYV